MSFEERLRQSLQAQATDLSPDPALWSAVQSRIRRARTFRLAFAGVAAALAVAGAAVAAPTLIDRRIEFERGPVATQPAEEPTTPAAAPGFTGNLVFTDDQDVYLLSGAEAPQHLFGIQCPAGAVCDSEPVRSVAARPQSPGADVAAVGASTCSGIEHTGGDARFMADTCPVSVAFSPDGGHLAWVGQAGPEGDWMLHTVDWTEDGPGEDDASFDLPWGVDQSVDIQDWVWDSQTLDGASGHIVLRTGMGGGPLLFELPIERQGDGSLGVTGQPKPVSSGQDLTPLAFTSGGATTYTIEVQQQPDGFEGQIVRRAGSDTTGTFELPPELFSNTNPPFAAADIWISAAAETVVYGNAGTRMAWALDWPATERQPAGLVNLDAEGQLLSVVHADVVAAVDAPAEQPRTQSQQPRTQSQVDVFFGMTGADACVADQPVQRQVEGQGVARAALTELLEGPSSRESNEGVESPFNANTAGALNDIAIIDGEARVDFDDFSTAVDDGSCTKSAILDGLNKTLLQFPSVTSTRYSFDGDPEAWQTWLGRHSDETATPPAAVVATAKEIHDAAVGHDWEALGRLSSETSCTLSDQKEPCVPHWQEQEANGADPLGTLVDLLSGEASRDPDAPMWVWPEEWAEPGTDYSGPRIGIDEGGIWRYYVQEGG
ncbi:MAG: hypothetical protein GEU74_03570 [Nitriliruptorales bacterium]|nr:hypothetical protein [Nitriliruptorales bacterium]